MARLLMVSSSFIERFDDEQQRVTKLSDCNVEVTFTIHNPLTQFKPSVPYSFFRYRRFIT